MIKILAGGKDKDSIFASSSSKHYNDLQLCHVYINVIVEGFTSSSRKPRRSGEIRLWLISAPIGPRGVKYWTEENLAFPLHSQVASSYCKLTFSLSILFNFIYLISCKLYISVFHIQCTCIIIDAELISIHDQEVKLS